jgi:phage terminase large subunit-like protein
MGGYETACHLTGRYPAWWPGRRFDHPVEGWACGKSYETTRDIVQAVLLGNVISGARKGLSGTGLIYGDCIGRPTWKKGVDDLVDTVPIKHASGGWSLLGLKSYEQGRGSFEGTAKHFVWDDEEPPMDVYNEQLIRTATTNGLSMCTFTPLLGMSEVVTGFLPKMDGAT